MNEMIIPLHSTVDENLRKILLPKLRDVGPAAQVNDFLCCDKFDIMDRIGEIKLPALVIVGDQDNMTPPKYSQYLVDSPAELQDGNYRRRRPSGFHGKTGPG